MPTYDAILIPGGGLTEQGTPPEWVKNRLDDAIQNRQGATLIPLSAGTTHKPPPLDDRGFPIFEAVANARYLRDHGVEPGKILIEASSYDTIGNAYFSRVIHTELRGFKKLLVVTSAFHMPRTEAIFRWVYGLDSAGYDLDFHSVPDVGMEEHVLRARLEKERQGLESLAPIRARVKTLADLHTWLFTEHAAYSTAGQDTKGQNAIGDAVNTY